MPPRHQHNNQVYTYKRKPDTRDMNLADKLKITPEEVVRRDDIVRNLWINCHFHVGEFLMPANPAKREQYGTNIKVMQIFKSYHDFPAHEKWPADDIPYIMTVKPDVEGSGLILCVSNFLCRRNGSDNGATC